MQLIIIKIIIVQYWSVEQNLIIGAQLLYNIVLASATYQHESATDIYMSPLESPSHLPPHPIPLGCHRTPGWAPCFAQ